MRKHTKLSMLAGVLALSSVQGRAQDAQTIADVRCVVVGLKATAMANSPQQGVGMMVGLYYIGRLDGRVPKLDIEDLIIKELSKMTASDYKAEAKRCGDSLAAKGHQITQIGNDMVERGY
jgi:hypothetical protein